MDSIEMDKKRLTAEMAFKDSSTVIRIRKRLPDFLQSVKLKYFTGLKLDGVPELWTNQSLRLESVDVATRLGASLILFFLFGLYCAKRSRPVCLVD
ncbi:hypothetical protein V6N13_011984 [Hibiscus sabdariffa]|uniref:Uncharacterized protein n=1 Tax=Hibiscus sabdariffa TaxID=183260 RepID=A0ABR2SDV4_9ROSI